MAELLQHTHWCAPAQGSMLWHVLGAVFWSGSRANKACAYQTCRLNKGRACVPTVLFGRYIDVSSVSPTTKPKAVPVWGCGLSFDKQGAQNHTQIGPTPHPDMEQYLRKHGRAHASKARFTNTPQQHMQPVASQLTRGQNHAGRIPRIPEHRTHSKQNTAHACTQHPAGLMDSCVSCTTHPSAAQPTKSSCGSDGL